MLGKVISVLHAMPVLTGDEIRRIVRSDGSYPFLKASDLADQIDRIKLTLEFLTLEELSKLWSVFFQIATPPIAAVPGNCRASGRRSLAAALSPRS